MNERVGKWKLSCYCQINRQLPSRRSKRVKKKKKKSFQWTTNFYRLAVTGLIDSTNYIINKKDKINEPVYSYKDSYMVPRWDKNKTNEFLVMVIGLSEAKQWIIHNFFCFIPPFLEVQYEF